MNLGWVGWETAAEENRKQVFPRVRERRIPCRPSLFLRVECAGLPQQNLLSLYNRLTEEPCLGVS